ncbi:hypothetical protein MHC_03160 [Mycoplasma haemocanis str. Illinois]|uniref:Uncharacterized protein n=1 Tax=Mycoplasma haemocanis (strain Illinois) TaxID=1111676 RepID=H6N770_MYCHN|nr:hypothetical protein [Mycoplasma haemocanis]AEW45492.1 hypothetical protein MHC_03160 [Mycoplasma haemocanis str. Illinois]
MSISTITKLSIGTVVAGGTGVAGWQIVSHINSRKTIAFYLSNKGRMVANSESSWQKLLSFYKSEKSDAISSLSKVNISHKDIKDWCLKETSKAFDGAEKNHLLLVESWCSEPKTLEEQIALKGRRKLSTDTSQSPNSDQTTWSSHKEAYKQEGDTYKIQQSSDNNNWTDVAKGNATEDLMKKWCKAQESQHFKHEEDILFQTYSKWCITDAEGTR